MPSPVVVLTIAGSDSSGGAGIQADIKTISALGGYAASAITALTAQNTTGVRAIHAPDAHFLAQQIDAVFEDLHVSGVKIGMLHNRDVVQAVAGRLRQHDPAHVVLDPVMVATSGAVLIDPQTVDSLVANLFPLASLITPNLDEAAFLLGQPINNLDGMRAAAAALINLGARAVLLKGGHLLDDDGSPSSKVVDLLMLADLSQHLFEQPRVATTNTHGTGCSLSAAIATFLALGQTLPQAVGAAQAYVHAGLEAAKGITIGKGHGPINHFFQPVAMRIRPT
ncbi:MAG: bifunctional hydroxymethylpyrimidine kinase/phosphomethylpyrimidine kinase [Proteobacteria bacterium]|nr:bifunctional hydroxymethylpyrimidine kinase/phosphomethylpyrimidine kinase [Pseudomonadota bacterium]